MKRTEQTGNFYIPPLLFARGKTHNLQYKLKDGCENTDAPRWQQSQNVQSYILTPHSRGMQFQFSVRNP